VGRGCSTAYTSGFWGANQKYSTPMTEVLGEKAAISSTGVRECDFFHPNVCESKRRKKGAQGERMKTISCQSTLQVLNLERRTAQREVFQRRALLEETENYSKPRAIKAYVGGKRKRKGNTNLLKPTKAEMGSL